MCRLTYLPLCSTGSSLGHTHPGTHCNVHATGLFTLSQVVVHADPQLLYTRLLGHDGTALVVPVFEEQ